MMLFYIGAAVLLVLAVLFVFWSFFVSRKNVNGAVSSADIRELTNVSLYRDHLADIDQSLHSAAITQAQYDQLKTELERNLLEDSQSSVMDVAPAVSTTKTVSILVLVVIVLFATAGYLYTQLGAYDAWQVKAALDKRTALEEQYFTTGDTDLAPLVVAAGRDLAKKLEVVIQQQPDNLQMHALLARTAMGLGDYDVAIQHFQAILIQEPTLSQIMAELAQAMFLKADNTVTPVAQSLVDETLSVDPENTVALGLAGIAAFQAEKYQAAIEHWRKAITLQAPQSQNSIALQRGIATAQERLGIDPATAVAEASIDSRPEPANTVVNPSITVSVSLAEGVEVEPDATVFVYARAWKGAKVPLSITRLQASELPITLTLTNAMSMAPSMNLNTAKAVELIARVSKSGTPVPQAGDWQVTLGPVEITENNTQPYTLMIADKVL